MKKIKIAFFDIDGTLIDMNTKRISEKMLETLVRLKENGIILCLATGRSPMALPHFKKVEFDAFLTFNGSYCFNSEKTIFSNPIPTEDIKQLIKNATEIGRPISVATKERLGANGADQDLVDYFAHANLEVEVADDFDTLLQEKVYQVMMGCYESDYTYMMKDIRNAKITAWWNRAVDIIPADGGKGKGIEKVLEYYHFDKSEAIAFGDGNNDIEMLQSVGTGVAMANGSDQLKVVADDVCGYVAEDGIYHYCLGHGLI
ncbi:Putative bifunctional phosphatase/peptidyl-prolyl cis-trans isomerase [Sebaldella termitidis]|uniref:Cof-like hydrolase n=1 Tax=Sebaldella termitidis (strain ATCC 33386 / NCTC 11300) TaxID=526218 RepID=D1AM10_SEBTE|nr:Cof-type HAD-IIB family hydrolase [Sebaldella termitidis]ACZ07278.1 Cof-like hydrolase [Sebaldella termitidis ATCC 33386]SUI22570.1 Putative bifunctional phosphatase/peptidyl-prolyl cis-trans isomerase [Sebaldella termitidis]